MRIKFDFTVHWLGTNDKPESTSFYVIDHSGHWESALRQAADAIEDSGCVITKIEVTQSKPVLPF